MATASNNQQPVRRVLLITLALNLLVAFGKIALGLMTGALAITADGFHSLTDGAGNIVGLIGSFYASRPADENHPYGHQRFETLAALLIGALLFLTAWEVFQGVLDRLQSASQPQITPLVFAVLIMTLLVNIGVSTFQMRAASRYASTILRADAENTRADVYVTLAVIISTAVVALTGWIWVDMLAATVVVILIGRAAWGILHQTGEVLVDTAPYDHSVLQEIIADVPADVVRARSRGQRGAAHIDIDVRVAPEMTTEQTNSIAYAIRQRLEGKLEGVEEIEVHFVPHHPHGRDPVLTARAYADARGLSTHEVQVTHGQQGNVLEMHVEVAPDQTLGDAHALVSQLEEDVVTALPQVDRVVTHIEPRHTEPDVADSPQVTQQMQAVQDRAMALLIDRFPEAGWHDACMRALPHGIGLSIHATLASAISVSDAHEFAEAAETLLRARLPDLQRVTIHTEPYDHD